MTTTSRRHAAVSRSRRLSPILLTVGLVLAALLAVASVWVPWASHVAVVVAGAAGIVAAVLAGREFVAHRAEHHAEARAASRANAELVRTIRADHAAVMGVLKRRNESLHGQLTQVRAEAGELAAQVSGLRGDVAALRAENTELRADNATLRADQAELVRQVEATHPEAELLVLPRRRAIDTTDGEGWSPADAETVIDLDLARLATPFVEDALRRHAN